MFQTISFSVKEKLKDCRRTDRTTSEESQQVSGGYPYNKGNIMLTHLQLKKLKSATNNISSQATR